MKPADLPPDGKSFPLPWRVTSHKFPTHFLPMTKPLDSLKQPNPSEKTAPRDDWLDSELSRLEDYEPYDWGEIDPLMLGKPVQYVSSIGLVVEGGKD